LYGTAHKRLYKDWKDGNEGREDYPRWLKTIQEKLYKDWKEGMKEGKAIPDGYRRKCI